MARRLASGSCQRLSSSVPSISRAISRTAIPSFYLVMRCRAPSVCRLEYDFHVFVTCPDGRQPSCSAWFGAGPLRWPEKGAVLEFLAYGHASHLLRQRIRTGIQRQDTEL